MTPETRSLTDDQPEVAASAPVPPMAASAVAPESIRLRLMGRRLTR